MESKTYNNRLLFVGVFFTLMLTLFTPSSFATLIQYEGVCVDGSDPLNQCSVLGLTPGEKITAEFTLGDRATWGSELSKQNMLSWHLDAGVFYADNSLTNNWDFKATLNANGLFDSFHLIGSLSHDGGALAGQKTFDIRLDSWFVTLNGHCADINGSLGDCRFPQVVNYLYFDQGPGQSMGFVYTFQVPAPTAAVLLISGLFFLSRKRG